MRLLGEHLHAVGFTVRGINLPGHGSRLEDMGKYTWKDWLQASKWRWRRCRSNAAM